jgi:thiol:disulfide interchange protein
MLAWAGGARAQENPIQWSATSKATKVRPAEAFKVELTMKAEEGWHVYSVTQAPPPVASRISLPAGQPYTLAATIETPAPHVAFDQNFGINVESYSETGLFTLPIKVAADAAPGKKPLKIEAYYQSCNDQMCLPPKKVTVEVPLEIVGGTAPADRGTLIPSSTASTPQPGGTAAPAAATSATSEPAPPAPGASRVLTDVRRPAAAGAASAPGAEAARDAHGTETQASVPASPAASALAGQSLWSFLWLAMTMGAVSLLTPCVFPMVPITVSYFTGAAAGSRKKAVGQAFTYMMGIVLTFTAIGMAMAVLVGATSLSRFAASPWVNLLIVAIFIGFALNLLGFYEITVPSALLTRLDGATRRTGGSRTAGTLLMALTFTLTSFTCTAPFIGTLLVMAAGGDWQWPLAGMLAFATVFALPFFLLALVPQWLAGLPKAGGWMNSVKVMMGLLVIAASTKFIANVDIVWGWGIFTHDVVLASWVAIALLMTAYVLGLFRFQHDSPVKHVGLVRFATALACGTLAFWLASGLAGKPLGDLDALLPLPTAATARASAGASGPAWLVNDYRGALSEARRTNRRVLLDFTGYTCTNCKWMETNMFPRPEVQRALGNFVLVRLYTDGSGEVYERQQQLQQALYKTVAIPYYAIVEPDGSPVLSFPGLTRDPQAFVAFLRKGVG